MLTPLSSHVNQTAPPSHPPFPLSFLFLSFFLSFSSSPVHLWTIFLLPQLPCLLFSIFFVFFGRAAPARRHRAALVRLSLVLLGSAVSQLAPVVSPSLPSAPSAAAPLRLLLRFVVVAEHLHLVATREPAPTSLRCRCPHLCCSPPEAQPSQSPSSSSRLHLPEPRPRRVVFSASSASSQPASAFVHPRCRPSASASLILVIRSSSASSSSPLAGVSPEQCHRSPEQ